MRLFTCVIAGPKKKDDRNENTDAGSDEQRIAPIDSRLRAVGGHIAHVDHIGAELGIRSDNIHQTEGAGEDPVLGHAQQSGKQDEIGSLKKKVHTLTKEKPGRLASNPMLP